MDVTRIRAAWVEAREHGCGAPSASIDATPGPLDPSSEARRGQAGVEVTARHFDGLGNDVPARANCSIGPREGVGPKQSATLSGFGTTHVWGATVRIGLTMGLVSLDRRRENGAPRSCRP